MVVKDIHMDLSQKHCVSCESGGQRLSPEEAIEMHLRYTPQWQVIENSTKISREFKFKNFKQALAFVNKVGEIAESEGHHPDIYFGWGYAKIHLQTHSIGGLHENDFIVASKIDKLA